MEISLFVPQDVVQNTLKMDLMVELDTEKFFP